MNRLHIDWTACDGRGLCTELLPELLDRDEWGYPAPRDGSRAPAVPPALEAHARRAVTECPRLALRLLDAAGNPAGPTSPSGKARPAGPKRPQRPRRPGPQSDQRK